jgi:hypothetical protein
METLAASLEKMDSQQGLGKVEREREREREREVY